MALKAAAPIGAVFTALALVTGSIWGKPMWGTWWVWDARLTSVFVLFLMYLGIIALTRALDDPGRAARAAAVMTLVGFVNIPIIKFSVDWWNTLHQPASVFRLDGPTIHPSLLWPLLVMALGFTLLFFTLHLMAMRNEIWRRRVAAMQRVEARRAERPEASCHERTCPLCRRRLWHLGARCLPAWSAGSCFDGQQARRRELRRAGGRGVRRRSQPAGAERP